MHRFVRLLGALTALVVCGACSGGGGGASSADLRTTHPNLAGRRLGTVLDSSGTAHTAYLTIDAPDEGDPSRANAVIATVGQPDTLVSRPGVIANNVGLSFRGWVRASSNIVTFESESGETSWVMAEVGSGLTYQDVATQSPTRFQSTFNGYGAESITTIEQYSTPDWFVQIVTTSRDSR